MKNHVLFKILSVFLFVFSTGSVLAQTEITRSFSEFGFENATQYPNGNLDANVWFTTQINSAGTAPTYYATGSAIRMYPGGGDGPWTSNEWSATAVWPAGAGGKLLA